jgi:hypothetical protein
MRVPYNRGGLRTYLIAIALLAGRTTPGWIAAGTPLLLIGIALHLWTKGCLHQEREVSAGGPYRFVRHPFYLANLFLDFGIALMGGWWPLLAAFAPWWLWIYLPTMREEEARMVELFGDAYRQYARSVPLLIPYRAPRPPAEGGFSWSNGNLWRTEFPRAFRFLSYPLMFFLAYRLRIRGWDFLSPAFADVLAASGCVALVAVGKDFRRHFKHARRILPAWMSADAFRFVPLIGIAVAISVGLQWVAVLLLPVQIAVVLDRRLPESAAAGRAG